MSNGIIPPLAVQNSGYWCTWDLQTFVADREGTASAYGLSGHGAQAEVLTERNLFGPGGWAHDDYFGPVKSDLLLVLDVGWDVPGTGVTKAWDDRLGSLEIAEDKFPSCRGTPAERLRALDGLVREAGWRGTGLWVHAQPARAATGQIEPSAEFIEQYFRERARWSSEAGIRYWKVDYGARCADIAFRHMLTRVVHDEAPGLLVEHARNIGPFNDQSIPAGGSAVCGTGSYVGWEGGSILEAALALVETSDIFRTYDASYTMAVPTTFDRTATLLSRSSGRSDTGCILNCEDEPVIAAATFSSVGIMHHPLQPVRRRMSFVRAVRFQRLAPPVGVGRVPTVLDPVRLSDRRRFQAGGDWVGWMNGHVVVQSAPARLARGMPLPEVASSGEPPFVIASRHPSGVAVVAALPRLSSDQGRHWPRADVTIALDGLDVPLGIFGRYRSLAVRLERPLPPEWRVIAHDLALDEPEDITDRVRPVSDGMVIDGALLERIGTAANDADDESDPGLVVLGVAPSAAP